MRPGKQEWTGEQDLFRARLDQIINLRHELVRLAGTIDWDWIDAELAGCFSDEGRPGLSTRFMVGLLLLKHIYGLSDEEVCARWEFDPYFQYFTGEEFFAHAFPHERSGLSHWRKRIGGKLEALLAESLRVAHATGALKPDDMARITVDTTVQPKNVTHPTDAKLMLTAIEKLGALAKANRVGLRQSYARLAKRAALMVGRYTHAKQFKRAKRELKFLRTRLGRLIRDITRKIDGDEALQTLFAVPLSKAMQIRWQNHNQRGPKLYSWHAPETECIGKGKAHKPYEFGTKVSITTTNRRCKGGQFVLHAKALPGNPFDGHTLAGVIEETQALTGREIERVYVDKGYRGHKARQPLRVFISGQKRGVHGAIKRELRRRSAIEPVIGHMKSDGHLGRNYLKGRHGDHANAVLSAVGYNLRLILAWLRQLLCLILLTIRDVRSPPSTFMPAS
ncbi:MAG: IS5 family transposase [Rhizobiaceae bacterium]|nr:MAG: IS5 family transposase [Rhizobiaceae bacterium]